MTQPGQAEVVVVRIEGRRALVELDRRIEVWVRLETLEAWAASRGVRQDGDGLE